MVPPLDNNLPPGTQLNQNNLTLGQFLGRGGFAITYQAHTKTQGRNVQEKSVAVKEFFPEGCLRSESIVQFPSSMGEAEQKLAKEKFLDEARLLSKLSHPNIVRVETTFEENNTAYMVMEFLKGRTLEQLIQETGPLPEKRALGYIKQIGAALTEVHRGNFIHRDIKPDNIIVRAPEQRLVSSNQEQVVLLDFGLNRELTPANTYHTLRLTNALRFGSPGYSPPEQYGHQAKFGAYTDIYALGATFYYLLSGEMLPDAPMRIAGEEITPLRNYQAKISKPVEDAIMWALQLKGNDRPQSVTEFLEALDTKTVAAAVSTTTIASSNRPAVHQATSLPRKVQMPPVSSQASRPVTVSSPGLAPTHPTQPQMGPSLPGHLGHKLKTLLVGAIPKLAAHIIRAIKRVMLDLWINFLEILPRFLLLAAIVFGLWWFFMRKPNQPYIPSKPLAKSKTTSSKKHPKKSGRKAPK